MTTAVGLYTAVFGVFADELSPLPIGMHGIAFVDSPRRDAPRGWTLRPGCWANEPPRRRARLHKLMPQACLAELPEITLWVDGTHVPKFPLEHYATYLLTSDLAVYRHTHRNCIYQEAEVCKKHRKDRSGVIDRQMATYHRQGFPHNAGLVETPVLLRRSNEACRQFNCRWMQLLQAGSLRDQLSFPVAAQQTGLDHNRLPGTAWDQHLFQYRAHVCAS